MNDLKKPQHIEGAPAEAPKADTKPAEPKAEAPKQQEKPKEHIPTPQEVATSYEKGDVVIFQNEKGVWQEGVLNSVPRVITKRDGKTQFKIEIGGSPDSFILNKAPKKAVGPDLLKKIPHQLVELNGKKYRVELFNKTAPISSDGSEEFRLVEYVSGTEKGFYTPEPSNKPNAEIKIISAEALKTIIEAEEARKHFDSEVQKLQEQVEKLEGIKTKDVYNKLAKLRKDVERISALTNYNLEEAEDVDTKELALINKKIESLQEKIEEDVKSLRRDIKMRGRAQSKEGERKNTKEKETNELKTKQETIKEIDDELKEKLASEKWRFERDNKEKKKQYTEELKLWEEEVKRKREWEAKKREGKATGTMPRVRTKPTEPKPTSNSDRDAELRYAILKKRGDSDALAEAVKKEVVKRIKKATGESVNPSTLDELEKEALLLIGSNPEQVKKIKTDTAEYKKMHDTLEAKKNHNKPLEQRIQTLQTENQNLQTRKTELDQKIASAEIYRQEDKQNRSELDEKIKEYNALRANESTAAEKRTELSKERNELQVQYEQLDAEKETGSRKEKARKKTELATLETTMRKLDDEIDALQNISQTLENLDTEITEKQVKAVATAGALEQAEKNNKLHEAEKKQIDARLGAIDVEIKDVEAQKQIITQAEKDELADKEDALNRNKTAVFSETQKTDAQIYIGEVAKEVFESWKKDVEQSAGGGTAPEVKADAFNFEEQKKELDDQIASLKTKLTKVSPKARKSLKGKLDDIETIVDEFEDDAPNIEKQMLAAWKDVTELEVAIDRAIPLHSREAEEIKELKEAKEKRFVVRELPAHVIQELLQSREAELGEVIQLLHEEELNTSKENEVTIIHAKNKVTEAVKNLFSAEAPNRATLDLLRRYGIRDWKTFKELWDSQYASHVGMMLHEDAQNAIDQDIKEDKLKLKERYFAWARGTPSDAELRQESIAVRLGVDLHDAGVAKTKAASLLSRSISTAMREINLELKLSIAENDADRAEILKALGRDKSDYTEVNGQFFIKNEEVRMIRESESNDIDKVIPKYKERHDLVVKMRDMMERTSLLLYKQQMDDLTDEEKEQLEKNAAFFRDILNQTNSTVEKNKMAVILAHYLTEQDQVKNIVYEYERLKEMRTSEEFFRAAREVEDLTKKILQKNPDAAKMVEKVAEQAKKAGPNAKSNPLKHAVIAAALAATIAGGMFKMWKPYDIEVRGPIPGSAVSQKDSGKQNSGGTTARGIPVNRDSSSQGGSAVASSKPENIRSGVTSVEAKPGSVESHRMTTIPIKWNFEKIYKFEDVMSKTFSSRMSAGEVLMATSSIKDIVGGITDPTDRKTAEKGLYYLIGSIDKDNSASSMERLRTMVNQKDNWQQVAADIIAIGKTVDKDSPYLQTEKEKRSEGKMVAEVRALERTYGNKDEFGKKFKGENAYMQWAPLVLKARIKIGPEYLSGSNAKPTKERLSALLFDVAGYMARIKKESNGNPADISSANAMGLFQIMPSTVETHCPNQSLADPEVQIACGIAELFKHSNMNDGEPIRTNIGYNAGEGTEKENPKVRGGLRGFQRAAGSTDNDKVLEWLAKGGWYVDKDESSLTKKEINSKKSLQRIPVYVRENMRLTGEFVQNHQWFNELLQRPEFRFLWADLKEDLPEFGLVARNAGVPNT